MSIRAAAWMMAGMKISCVVWLATVFSVVPATTESGDQSARVAAIARYNGSDRTEKLVQGAKRERTLTLYSSAPPEDANPLISAFEKKYSVKVEVWRASSERIVQRAVVERRGNRFDVDVFETQGMIMEALGRENLLQQVRTPIVTELTPAAIQPHGLWIGDRLQILTASYNTNLIKKVDLPTNYADLVDPKWKGKLAIDSDAVDWFQGVVSEMGEDRGIKLFREIVAKNDISVRKGKALLAKLVAAGEVPLALTTYLYKAEQIKQAGEPLDLLFIPPTLARFGGIGLAQRSPHPYAGLLFIDWLLSDGQRILAEREFFPANVKVKPLPSDLSLKALDAVQLLDGNEKWQKLFQEIILNKGR
jgi:iron(III) transport system substrate-binding protein